MTSPTNFALGWAALAVLAALSNGCGAHPTQPPSGPPARAGAPARLDLIVFSSNRGGRWAIWAMRPDGSRMKPLSEPAEGESDVDAVVSPDGKSILFTSTRGGAAGLWRMNLAGTGLARLCGGDQGEWSGDGTKIVFRRAGRLVVRSLATGQEKTISPDGWDKCSGPAWSPEGRTIAFAVLGQTGNALYLVPAEGGPARKVYDAQGACEPHWSPAGDRLVYETEAHLFTINPDGTKNRPLTYYGGVQRYGRFNPDVTQVIFCQAATPEGPWELYTVPAGGGAPTRLTEGGSDMQPDWR